jgi:periplasmic protein TonB
MESVSLSVISKMIQKENRPYRIKAMGLSIIVHAAIFTAVIHAVHIPTPVIALQRESVAVSLAGFTPERPENTGKQTTVKRNAPHDKKHVKHVRKHPVKQTPAKPKRHRVVHPEPAKNSASKLPLSAHDIQKAPHKTPEIKTPQTKPAPLSEASASKPSQPVTSAAPTDSPLAADGTPLLSSPSAKPTPAASGPGATVLGRIRAMIENAMTYPALARRLRIEGIVVLSFVLSTDGHVVKAEVHDSSGSSVLDRKALNTLWELSGDFPSLESSTQLTIPITFTLKKS